MSDELSSSDLRKLREVAGESTSSDVQRFQVAGDRYELRGPIGEGATSVVYEAWDRELRRAVALKVLKGGSVMPAVWRERFRREAHIMARLSHPNLVLVHDLGETAGQLYIVLELVKGTPLNRMLVGGTTDTDWIARVLERVARAVHHAHEAGVVHRDIKPANIIIQETGEPKVADFGVAHDAMASATLATRPGSVIGTPVYMAPEQVSGRNLEISPRTDVYALGTILYEGLVGRPPFMADSVTEIQRKIALDEPVRPRRLRPGTPRDLETIALKCLEKRPVERYATAAALADDLSRYLKGEPIAAKPAPLPLRLARKARRHRTTIITVGTTILVSLTAAWLVDRGLSSRGLRHALEEAARLEQRGDVSGAREAYQQAITIAPANAPARDGLARTSDRLAVHAANRQKALGLLESARLSLDKARRVFYVPEGDYAEISRHAQAAEGMIRSAMQMDQTLAAAHHLLAQVKETTGLYDEATAAASHAVEMDARFGAAHYTLARLLLLKAVLLHSRTRIERREPDAPASLAKDAIGHLQMAESCGLEAELPRQVARAYVAYYANDRQALKRILDSCIDRYASAEGVEDLHWLSAHLAASDQQRMAAYDRALAMSPWHVPSLLLRCVLRSEAGDWDGALADMNSLIRINPHLAEAHGNRGFIRVHRGELEAAVADYTEAIALDPRIAAVYNGRGYANALMGRTAEARWDYDKAIELNPDYERPYTNRAALRLDGGDVDGALSDVERALAISPASAYAHQVRGICRCQRGQLLDASADFDRAIQLDPGEAGAFYNRGMLRYSQGDDARAIADLGEAVRLDPKYFKAYTLRGMVLLRLGDKSAAIQDFEKALELAPRNWPKRPEIEDLMTRIKKDE